MNNNLSTVEAPNNMPKNGIMAQMDNLNQGTVAIEASRAIAEAQGKLVIAKRFPRDEVACFANMSKACSRKGIAEKAFFSYNRGGSTVSGCTIRLAEELARCWGNIDYGIKELSQDDGKSEMQAYAWDLETNAISVQNFTNPHIREVKGVAKKLTSQRDIYEINANMGARRLRSRILAVLPADFVDEAIRLCKQTLAGNSDEPLIDRVKKMVVAFEKLGVSQEQIEKRLKRKITTMTADDFVDYIGIYNSLKENNSSVRDWFDMPVGAEELTAQLDEEIKKDEVNSK